MICQPCRRAGAALATWPAGTPTGALDLMHQQCPGGTWCDCQHHTDRRATPR